MKKEALLFQREAEKVRCLLCPRYCLIKEDKLGYCKVRQVKNGQLFTLIYGEVSSLALDPIEKKPLFHFFPGSLVLSFGTLGCNLRCLHCQNWSIAHADTLTGPETQYIPPEKAVELAQRSQAQGIAWTYNEPSIWLEYTLDTAKLAKKSELYTVYVTNGYLTAEALDLMGPYLDAFRFDLKGFTKELYRKLCKVTEFKPILDSAERAKNKWGMHVEVVTNVIPGWNDSAEEIKEMAAWIKTKLGAKTPWHITRFYPHLELSHLPPTPIKTLEKIREIGLEAGLEFVYLGNVPSHPGENTICPKCGKTVIKRSGYTLHALHVSEGKCEFCGEDLYVKDRLEKDGSS